MVFSSITFTFLFLPIVVVMYYLAKESYRNYLLLLASLIFYAYGEPKFVFVMMASIAVNYFLALLIAKQKDGSKEGAAGAILVIDIIANVAILFVFKYLGFAGRLINGLFRSNMPVAEIALPIGISFFTFQAMSYVIDVYRGTVKVQKNPLYVALYISFFPQLVAGPIVRYSTIEEQITKRICTTEKFAEGVRRFFLGFGKKVIIANNVALVASDVFAMDYKATNPALLWLGSICYTLQIFYDFSGYSDMAIGLGKMFGFDFEENFNYPYISKSITEFWRRWHISLSGWFKDYVYIPLGGSRVSLPRNIFNLFVVWLLTGIWHGANYTFIAWGLGYFVLLIIEKFVVKPEKRTNKILKVVWQIFTLLCVNWLWVLFNSAGIKDGIKFCLGTLGIWGTKWAIDPAMIRYFREYGFFIIIGILFSTPIMKKISEKMDGNNATAWIKAIGAPLGYGFVFLWAVSYLILGAHNPFIYFNF